MPFDCPPIPSAAAGRPPSATLRAMTLTLVMAVAPAAATFFRRDGAKPKPTGQGDSPLAFIAAGFVFGIVLGLAVLLFEVLFITPAAAGEKKRPWNDVRVSGFIGSEVRWFPETPAHAGQYAGAEASLLINPEFRWRSQDRRHRVAFVPFARLAGRDAERTHGDIREAYHLYLGDEVEILTGFNKVFWGVTESRHLVDIINQTDLVEDTDDEDKLGQPMINIATQQDGGRLGLFILPGFRERTFAGDTGRLRSGSPVDENAAEYEASLGRANVDLALRYTHVIGDVDLGLSVFRGTARDPRLVATGRGTLAPYYDTITQGGLDLQYTTNAWLWKFEGIAREGQGKSFLATVFGFEYTLYQIAGTDADLGLLAEYQYDGRDPADGAGVLADDDVFLGARLALNDIQDTQALAGMVIDRDDGTMFFSVEMSRRLGTDWKAELEARMLTNVDSENGADPFRRDTFLNVRLSRYF